MRFHLIRHGERLDVADPDLWEGWVRSGHVDVHDPPITRLGAHQAERVARFFARENVARERRRWTTSNLNLEAHQSEAEHLLQSQSEGEHLLQSPYFSTVVTPPVVAIVSSPTLRTAMTANVIAALLGLPVFVEPGLSEFNSPHFFGKNPPHWLNAEELKNRHGLTMIDCRHNSVTSEPNWPEKGGDLVRRLNEAIRQIERHFSNGQRPAGGAVLLVSHSWAHTAAMDCIGGYNFFDSATPGPRPAEPRYCSLSSFDTGAGQFSIFCGLVVEKKIDNGENTRSENLAMEEENDNEKIEKLVSLLVHQSTEAVRIQLDRVEHRVTCSLRQKDPLRIKIIGIDGLDDSLCEDVAASMVQWFPPSSCHRVSVRETATTSYLDQEAADLTDALATHIRKSVNVAAALAHAKGKDYLIVDGPFLQLVPLKDLFSAVVFCKSSPGPWISRRLRSGSTVIRDQLLDLCAGWAQYEHQYRPWTPENAVAVFHAPDDRGAAMLLQSSVVLMYGSVFESGAEETELMDKAEMGFNTATGTGCRRPPSSSAAEDNDNDGFDDDDDGEPWTILYASSSVPSPFGAGFQVKTLVYGDDDLIDYGRLSISRAHGSFVSGAGGSRQQGTVQVVCTLTGTSNVIGFLQLCLVGARLVVQRIIVRRNFFYSPASRVPAALLSAGLRAVQWRDCVVDLLDPQTGQADERAAATDCRCRMDWQFDFFTTAGFVLDASGEKKNTPNTAKRMVLTSADQFAWKHVASSHCGWLAGSEPARQVSIDLIGKKD